MSRRQWVEDIDAISDYIVVHDRSCKIVRTNRSLASYLGVPPVALVGEAMSSLRQIAETGSDLPCPFCRDTQRSKEEYVAASAERSEEHTSELQSRLHLVCRLLLEKKKKELKI